MGACAGPSPWYPPPPPSAGIAYQFGKPWKCGYCKTYQNSSLVKCVNCGAAREATNENR